MIVNLFTHFYQSCIMYKYKIISYDTDIKTLHDLTNYLTIHKCNTITTSKLIWGYKQTFTLLKKKLKLPVFGRAAFSYSAVQPPFDILTSPSHWATLGN